MTWETWDRQIEEDSKAERLDFLMRKAFDFFFFIIITIKFLSAIRANAVAEFCFRMITDI